jgi:preprotein translocase subunit YajC
MKSAIYSELSKAAGIKFKTGEDLQAYFIELLKGIASLKDPEWDALSVEAQDWYNAAAKAKNKKEPIVDFPDLEKEKEEEEAPRRSRRKAEEEEDDKGSEELMLKVGDEVTVVNAKGKERVGTIVEQDAKMLVIKDNGDGEEYEYTRATLQSITKKNGDVEEDQPRRSRRKAEEEDEPAVPEIKKGDKVVAVTKRGKTIKGVVEKISDDMVSIDDGDDVWDFEKERLESLLPDGVTKTVKKEEDGDEAPRRGRTSTKEKEEPKEEGARTRSSNKEGVSIGQRIRELIAEDLDITEEAIGKQLKKEGIDFKENTLNLNYKESMKFIAILKAAKRLK